MKLARLSGRKVCERVLKRGQTWKGKHMKMTYLIVDPFRSGDVLRQAQHDVLYVGTIASTKLEKSAVKRNRMRRRCREALRVTLQEIRDQKSETRNVQLLLHPRLSSLTCDFGELHEDMRNFLKHIQKI